MIRGTALVLALALATVLAVPGLAASPAPTSDLTAGPPAGSWTAYDPETGPKTAADTFGSAASKVSGFSDTYRRVWTGSEQVVIDEVEHFTSVVWASVRYTESKNAASKNPNHSSFKTIPSFTTQAYETTDPADAQGLLGDTIIFSKGDYVAIVVVSATGSVPRDVLMDQATRQLNLLPAANAEYTSIGQGLFIGGAALVIVVGVLILAVILLVRRRRPPQAPSVPLSPDGRYWWDGAQWREMPPPARAPFS